MSGKLPLQQPLPLMQTSWSSMLNPILNLPIINGVLIKNVSLIAANNPTQVNHRLGRKLVGWQLSRQRNVPAQVYDTQDSNTIPDLTLLLNTTADIVVDIWCF